MNSYQKEQLETLLMIRKHLATLSANEKKALNGQSTDYLRFRKAVDAFLSEHFGKICTQKCFQSRLSACCSRDGIITFFGDVVINILVSSETEIRVLETAIQKPKDEFKCIYLGNHGCLWRVKPIVCQMFLCNTAKQDVFGRNNQAEKTWNTLQTQRKRFTWPDRPVLFDDLERIFIEAGYSSPLMYLHNSPGLLRVKKQYKESLKR